MSPPPAPPTDPPPSTSSPPTDSESPREEAEEADDAEENESDRPPPVGRGLALVWRNRASVADTTSAPGSAPDVVVVVVVRGAIE